MMGTASAPSDLLRGTKTHADTNDSHYDVLQAVDYINDGSAALSSVDEHEGMEAYHHELMTSDLASMTSLSAQLDAESMQKGPNKQKKTKTKGTRLPGICHHGKRRCQCIQCYDEGTGGSIICEHRRQRYACPRCFDAGRPTNSLCSHRIVKFKCRICTPVPPERKKYKKRGQNEGEGSGDSAYAGNIKPPRKNAADPNKPKKKRGPRPKSSFNEEESTEPDQENGMRSANTNPEDLQGAMATMVRARIGYFPVDDDCEDVGLHPDDPNIMYGEAGMEHDGHQHDSHFGEYHESPYAQHPYNEMQDIPFEHHGQTHFTHGQQMPLSNIIGFGGEMVALAAEPPNGIMEWRCVECGVVSEGCPDTPYLDQMVCASCRDARDLHGASAFQSFHPPAGPGATYRAMYEDYAIPYSAGVTPPLSHMALAYPPTAINSAGATRVAQSTNVAESQHEPLAPAESNAAGTALQVPSNAPLSEAADDVPPPWLHTDASLLPSAAIGGISGERERLDSPTFSVIAGGYVVSRGPSSRAISGAATPITHLLQQENSGEEQQQGSNDNTGHPADHESGEQGSAKLEPRSVPRQRQLSAQQRLRHLAHQNQHQHRYAQQQDQQLHHNQHNRHNQQHHHQQQQQQLQHHQQQHQSQLLQPHLSYQNQSAPRVPRAYPVYHQSQYFQEHELSPDQTQQQMVDPVTVTYVMDQTQMIQHAGDMAYLEHIGEEGNMWLEPGQPHYVPHNQYYPQPGFHSVTGGQWSASPAGGEDWMAGGGASEEHQEIPSIVIENVDDVVGAEEYYVSGEGGAVIDPASAMSTGGSSWRADYPPPPMGMFSAQKQMTGNGRSSASGSRNQQQFHARQGNRSQEV